jgi:hypothetical protein
LVREAAAHTRARTGADQRHRQGRKPQVPARKPEDQRPGASR